MRRLDFVTDTGQRAEVKAPIRTRVCLLGVICLYGSVLVLLADTRILPGLDGDRYAFMESLVERGVLHVDEASIQSVDRIHVGTHFYPAKPPLLSFAGAGLYWVLHHGLGWRFTTHPDQLVRSMTAVFVVVPVCFLLWMFFTASWQRACATGSSRPRIVASLLTAMLALASILLPYCVCFTNHPLAAALLFGAFAALANARAQSRGSIWFAAGLLSGFSAAVDLIPGTVFFGVCLAAAVARRDRSALWLLAGGAVPAAIHFSLNLVSLGTLLPGYLIPGGQNYPGSIWMTQSRVSDGDEFPDYLSASYHYVIGHRSVLLFEPLLFVGAAAAIAVWRRCESAMRLPAAAAVVVLAALMVLVPWFSMDVGGTVYGPRHLVPAAALLYFWLPDAARAARRTAAKTAAVLLIAWSLLVNVIGVVDPWTGDSTSVYAPLNVLARKAAAVGYDEVASRIIEYTAPNAAHGFASLGLDHWKAGRPEKAIATFERALRIEPYRGEALYGLGIAAKQTGRIAQALAAFERLATQEPGNAWAWGNLAQLRLAAGDADAAGRAFAEGLKLDPANPEVRAAQTQLKTHELHNRN